MYVFIYLSDPTQLSAERIPTQLGEISKCIKMHQQTYRKMHQKSSPNGRKIDEKSGFGGSWGLYRGLGAMLAPKSNLSTPGTKIGHPGLPKLGPS